MEKPYSTIQMDNFYDTLGHGLVKPSGIMNYIQHLIIAEKCQNFPSVLEVCCGRGLILPLLNRYSKNIQNYVGVDLSPENLREAKEEKARHCPETYFRCEFIQGNIIELTKFLNQRFDAVIYTSSIEHMEKDDGEQSVSQIRKVLNDQGYLFLSTPRTKKGTPIQYRVHIYEWDYEETRDCLARNDFEIIEEIGLLPGNDVDYPSMLAARFGEGAALWLNTLQKKIPEPFLSTITAASLPEEAKEILYICKKR